MNFKCFFSHDWHNVRSIVIEANGNISTLKDVYSALGEHKHSDRICKKCDKVEFNRETAIKVHSEMKKRRREKRVEENAAAVSINERFNSFKRMRDIARG